MVRETGEKAFNGFWLDGSFSWPYRGPPVERKRKLMKIRDLSRHAREAAANHRGGPEAQTNRPEVNVRSFHESSFRQKGTLCPVDQLPLKALIKVLIRFYRLSLSLSFSLDRWWWFLCCSLPTAKTPEFSRFCLPFPSLAPAPSPEKIRETNVYFSRSST